MSTTIRLRLVIRRHAVPEVKLVWPCVANDDLTVARLLALVNEVVPLESGDWGLEDYVVELYDGKGDSFELLHFQPVGKVLKEDDQVLIRSLSTEDLRRRKLSGRHQISYDGKHLIDGLAFGRPWLRAPRDRPALDLPPRKRARITHEEKLDEDDDDGSYADEENQSEQLLLEDSEAPEMGEPGSVRMRVRFMDSDQLEDEDEDEDLEDLEDLEDENEFQPIEEAHAETAADEEDEDDAESIDEDDLDADLSDELRLLQEDNAIVEQTPAKEQETLLSGDDSQDPQSLLPTHGFDVSWLDKITALRAAFPLTPVSTLQDEMNRNKDLRKTYEKLAEANKPVINYDEALERVLLGPGFPDALSPDQPADEEEEDPEDRVLLLPGQAEHKDATRPLIQEIEEESAPVSTPRVSQDQISRPLISEVPDEEEDTSSSSSSLDSDSDPDSDAEYDVDMEKKLDSESNSDSDDSDDDSSDDSDFPAPATPSRPAKTTQEDSEDSDSSDSDSDSDSDSSSDSSNGAEATKDSAESDSDNSSDSSSDSDSSSSESDSESEPEEISSKRQPQTKQPQPQPPAKTEPEPRASGQTAKAASEPTQGPKPPGTGLARTQKRNARKRDAKRLKAIQALEDTPSQPSVNGTASEEAELLARKRALLSVVSDEQEDESRPPKDAPNKETRPMIVEIEVEEETPAVTTSQDLAPVEEEPMPAQRRHKVDMGAGRRLLLGALGIKNPKNKAEEDKLRDSLMKNVKPLQNPRVQVEEDKVKDDKPAEEQPDEDPEAWRKKISYRAVECCHNDVVLSEPPFPFVQRWDPQQQYGSMRKRKRASQNFNDESYYEEDSQQWNGDEEWNDNSQRKKKKNKKRKNKSGYDGEYDEEESREGSFGTGANGDEDIVLNYDDIPTKHRPEESQFTDTDDLPSLPSDVTTLPSLSLSDMKPGMVATWKQLVMSKATNWQPEMVQMTGLILSISEDNCMHVLLAMRDREGNDKEYDEHTGQRIYAKFEAPDLDEDEEDDGRREIPWTEMSDPRLVQPAPPPTMLETSAKSIKLQAEQNKPVQNGNSTANNKVSARTDPDETMAEELDTQKVRAEVEADLRGQETEGQPSGTDKSTSIPSGQQPPRLEFPPSGNDSPMSSFVQPAGPWGKFDSHIHQLRESMQASMSQLQSLLSRDSDKGKQDNEEEDKAGNDEPDGAKDAKESEGEPVPTAEGSWDAVIPDTIPSPELPPLPTKDGVVVDHRLLVVPSSAGSVRSGRQPPSASGLDDLPEERIEESVEGGIVDDPHGRSASPQVTNNSRPRSSSPFPSLEEIFHTARQTQSPFKFSQMSVPQFIKSEKKDGDYEEAMRKLDEGEESDRSPDRNKSLRSLLLNATQPESQKGSPLVRSFKSEGSKPEASEPQHATTPPTSQKVKQESQFAIPEGSQVIELSSSPVSVQYAEDYAQDSEDETYQDSPLPQGSGWVQKKQSEVNTRSRGRSLPATEAKKTTVVQSRTTRGQTSAPVARGVSTSAYSQIKGRRKTTRKF